MPYRESKGKEKTLLVDPTTINSKNRCLFSRAMAGNEVTNWQNYKHELDSYKKAIRRANQSAWPTFCSEIRKTTDAARRRKILSKTADPLAIFRRQMDDQTPVESPRTCS